METEEVKKQFHEGGIEFRPIWFGYKLCPKVLPSNGRLVKEPDFTVVYWLELVSSSLNLHSTQATIRSHSAQSNPCSQFSPSPSSSITIAFSRIPIPTG